jgi:hypothetical protein
VNETERTPEAPRDPLFVRIERSALAMTGVLAAVAWLIPRGGANAAAGVVGGAVLVGASYWAIKRGVTGLADAVLATGRRVNPARALVLLMLRYGVLALLGYVLVVRLRLNPLGLLAGASVVTAAAAIEALRYQGGKR